MFGSRKWTTGNARSRFVLITTLPEGLPAWSARKRTYDEQLLERHHTVAIAVDGTRAQSFSEPRHDTAIITACVRDQDIGTRRGPHSLERAVLRRHQFRSDQ